MRVRTLVISDLHLGTRTRRSALQRPEPLARLLEALGGVDRLVLLGDVVELLEGHDAEALAVAEPILRAIGARMGPEREIVVVPGNHDYELVAPWLRARGESPATDEQVPLDATPLLARVVSWLAPARVRVHYPGVWLAPGVWATHGHYVNKHLRPHEPWGMLRRGPGDAAVPSDYDATPGVWLKKDVRQLMHASARPGPRPPWYLRPLSPLALRVLRVQVRRASLPALSHVLQRLGVQADVVIFGHIHRHGPLPADEPRDWATPDGRTRLVNTGSWLYEPLVLESARRANPYWPGGAVLLEDGAPPRTIGLLDGLDAADVH